MKYLAVIPARIGSKGIPKKNIKPLLGKPLIHYSIEKALKVFNKKDICISTDSKEIVSVAEELSITPPFLRPKELATDHTTTRDVLLHALNHYEANGIYYDSIVLLQPTSPLRKATHIKEAIDLYSEHLDMVVSTFETPSNPYYVLFEENKKGFLEKSKKGDFTRRQDCPKVWEYNGSIYVINANSLRKSKISAFSKIVKYVMEPEYSIDLDTPKDWMIAECMLKSK